MGTYKVYGSQVVDADTGTIVWNGSVKEVKELLEQRESLLETNDRLFELLEEAEEENARLRQLLNEEEALREITQADLDAIGGTYHE